MYILILSNPNIIFIFFNLAKMSINIINSGLNVKSQEVYLIINLLKINRNYY